MSLRNKNIIKILALSFIIQICVHNTIAQINTSSFSTPPDSTKVLTWWHWINGHVSKSGIQKDLETMQKVGIGGSILFNIGFFPEGEISFNSDAWWDLVKYSIQKSDSLGLKFGVFNSDGWSMSGGPWISADESMKELTYSDTVLHGGKIFNGFLPRPCVSDSCYNVATIAFPYMEKDEPFKPESAQIGYNVVDPVLLIDSSESTQSEFRYSSDSVPFVLFEFKKNCKVQSLTISNISANNFLDAAAYIEYSTDGLSYKQLNQNLPINLKSEGINKGLTLSFPEMDARYIRLFVRFDQTSTPAPANFNQTVVKLGDIRFYGIPKVVLWESKTGAAKRIRHDKQLINIQEMNHWENKESNSDSSINKNQIVNLTDKRSKDGRLVWNVPNGKWKVIQVAYTSTLKKNGPASKYGKGYECNKMDSNAVITHFNSYVAKVNALSLQVIGKPIDYMQIESWEAGIQNWTKDFEKFFEEKTGYSITPWFPVLTQGLVVNSIDESNRFLWDYRNVMAELIRKNYWEVMYKLANNKGIQVLAEGSGMQHYLYDPAKYMQHSDIPMGEFWTNEGKVRADCKNAATVAHINRKSIVAAEAFTAGGSDIWKHTPNDFKLLGDEAFTAGVNQFVLHSYVHQPYEIGPGITLLKWGNCFQRYNIWFPYSSGWLQYLQRCQFMLQQGTLVTDVCFFTGEGIPAYLGLRDELKPAIPNGYDYDGIDSKALQKLVVEEDKIVLPDIASWSLLVIPDSEKITPKILSSILKIVEEGGRVMMEKPKKSPSLIGYPKCDLIIKKLTDKVWNNSETFPDYSVVKYGSGEFFFNCSMKDVLKAQGLVSDFSFQINGQDSVEALKYTHRRLADQDVYFVDNCIKEKIQPVLRFRQLNKVPLILNPYNGNVFSVPFSEKNNYTELTLEFEEYDAYIILFGKEITKEKDSYTTERILTFDAPYTLNFNNGYFKLDTMCNTLADWSKTDDQRIRYYSGVVEYTNHIELIPQKKRSYILDLNTVYNISEVYINDHFVANLWKAPYQVDITKYLTSGKNEIKIRVVNSSVNQMIGDERFQPDIEYDRFSTITEFPAWLYNESVKRNSNRQTFITYKYNYTDSDLQPSGIVGDIKIIVKRPKK